MELGEITESEIWTVGYMLKSFDLPMACLTPCMDKVLNHFENLCSNLSHVLGNEEESDWPNGQRYMGSVFHIFPSSKFYTPFTTNQTNADVAMDTAFCIMLELREIYLTNGEGDPTDIFAILGDTDEDE